MATISLGGGPTVEERRSFAGLKDGTHVPGYRGYCPGMKYRVGNTYGADTHQLHKSFEPSRSGMPSTLLPDTGKPALRNILPESTGDNKYVRQMVPGYTGYIPRKQYRFGGTYRDDCDVCIDQHMSDFQEHSRKKFDLRSSVKGATRLEPIKGIVNDKLNLFRSSDLHQPLLIDDKKPLGEPPMPGYQGYIPRVHTTELGLGCRYHQMTKNGLDAFQAEAAQREASLSAPISIERQVGSLANNNRRLYPHAGMIPKYTGYVPQRRYNFGQTYGNTTRSLDVCAHDKSNFGEFNLRMSSLA